MVRKKESPEVTSHCTFSHWLWGSQSELRDLGKPQPFSHFSVDSTVPSDSIRSSTFPEPLTPLHNETTAAWTSATRTTFQLSPARPAERCLCVEVCRKTAFMLLSKQPEGSQHAVKTDFVWATVLFAFGILGASAVTVSYSFAYIYFKPHCEQAEMVLK